MIDKSSCVVAELLNACFADISQKDTIGLHLEQEWGISDPELLERIRVSIIRLILEKGDYDYIDSVFQLAHLDWRDLLMASGNKTPQDHKEWAERILLKPPRIRLLISSTVKVTVKDDHWAKCPKCNFRFKTTDPNAWDGIRHKRCLQKLQLETEK